MSIETKKAFFALVKGCDALNGALARDPKDATVPALFESNKNSAAPVYPCLTFRIPQGKPDARFQPTAAEGGGSSPIFDETLEVEVWSQKDTSYEVLHISDLLVPLLDGRAILLPGFGRIYKAEVTLRSDSLWDPKNNCYFLLLRFRLRVEKEAQGPQEDA